MSMHMKHIFLLALLLLVTSCMKEIDLEHLRPEPKLVLNCVIIQDKPIIGFTQRAELTFLWKTRMSSYT